MRRSTGDANGDRKTMAVGHCHDLRPFATPGGADSGAPFFAPLNEPSMYASETSMPPRLLKSSASNSSAVRSLPSRTQFCNRRWQVWYGGYRSGRSFHGAPVRRIQSTPLSTSRAFRHGLPRPSSRRGSSNIGLSFAHCASVRSMLAFCQHSAVPAILIVRLVPL
jgi:hypothetical protein